MLHKHQKLEVQEINHQVILSRRKQAIQVTRLAATCVGKLETQMKGLGSSEKGAKLPAGQKE